jgi:O-antigen ligase
MSIAVEQPIAAPAIAEPAAGRLERFAVRLLQLGAIAVVLVVSTHKVFELDRFFVPKELVLHLAAVAVGLFAMRAIRRAPVLLSDRLLYAYLLVSAISALLATNPWIGFRALALSVSSVVLFRAARGLSHAGFTRPLLAAVATGVVLVAVTSLLQAYGVRTDLFSINRSPGGTLGNRNFVGHVAAFGLTSVVIASLRASRLVGHLAGALGAGVVSAALVLTRSRAAWLAAAVVLAVLAFSFFVSRPIRGDGRTWRRLAFVGLCAIAGAAAALLLPNALRWRSDNPYLESVVGVAEFDEGSGRGRLIQYERSLRMAAAHPILGVGPGNWPVVYPAHAPRSDRSMSRTEGGMTSNPWPSSDWIAFVSERGFLAALLLWGALVALAWTALRRLRVMTERDDALMAAALLGTTAGALVTGAFDAVLLLALPALLVWTALGTLSSPLHRPDERLPGAAGTSVLLILLAIAALGAVRSAAQLVSMDLYARRSDRAPLELATRLDPGNYHAHLKLARGGKRRCRHALAALALYPNADAAQRAARGCD